VKVLEELDAETRYKRNLEACNLLVKDGYKINFAISHLLHAFKKTRVLNAMEIRAQWVSALKKPAPKDNWFALYIHIPFCRSKCTYCLFNTNLIEPKENLSCYVENLIKEIKYFSAPFKGIEFHSVYFGGGTASILSENQIERLLDSVNSNYKILKYCRRTYECNPDSTTREKLKIMRAGGITRVSFGVQSLNPGTLKLVNRGYQSTTMVKNAIRNASELGFHWINVDLMFGLEGDTNESFLKSFEGIMELGEVNISLYPLQPIASYLEKTGLSGVQFSEKMQKRLTEIEPRLRELAEKYDYNILGKIFYPRDADGIPFLKEKTFRKNQADHNLFRTEGFCDSYYLNHPSIFGVLGFGHGAMSKIGSSLKIQQQTPKAQLNREPFSENEKKYYCLFKKKREIMIEYLLFSFASEKSAVSKSEFREKFGLDIANVFGSEITALEELGKIQIKADKIELLEHNAKKAFASLMLFIDDDEVRRRFHNKPM